MVRGVQSITQHRNWFFHLLALTTQEFVGKTLETTLAKPELSPAEKVDFLLAMTVASNIYTHAQGWQHLGVINNEVIKKVEGLADKELTYRARSGILVVHPTSVEKECVKYLPDKIVIPGYLFSRDEEMQTKGLRMERDTYAKLVARVIKWENVLESVEVIDVPERKFSNTFGKTCDCPDGVKVIGGEGSESFANAFHQSEAYEVLEGVNVDRATQDREWVDSDGAQLMSQMMLHSVYYHFQDPTTVPMFMSFFHQHFQEGRVVTLMTNGSNQRYSAIGETQARTVPGLFSDTTEEWRAYVSKRIANMNPETMTYFAAVLPFLTVSRSILDLVCKRAYCSQVNFTPLVPTVHSQSTVETD